MAAMQLNGIMAARAATQTICKRGYRGQTHERMQGWLSWYQSCSRGTSPNLASLHRCAQVATKMVPQPATKVAALHVYSQGPAPLCSPLPLHATTIVLHLYVYS